MSFFVVFLYTECDDGYFGENCTLQCRCSDGDICAKENGNCPSHCAAGWNGTSCQDGKVFLLTISVISSLIICMKDCVSEQSS